MAKHPVEGFGEEEEMQGSGEPSGHDGLPGRKVAVGHGPVLDGVEQKHLHHQVHGHVAHSPRSHFTK